mmetsp:Transcript_54109/g.126422  ORF Transcript_54109/g.126422 Transcript_54109/m.126422 type:complete len:201 (-) Transcript_54109:172-774(-)
MASSTHRGVATSLQPFRTCLTSATMRFSSPYGKSQSLPVFASLSPRILPKAARTFGSRALRLVAPSLHVSRLHSSTFSSTPLASTLPFCISAMGDEFDDGGLGIDVDAELPPPVNDPGMRRAPVTPPPGMLCRAPEDAKLVSGVVSSLIACKRDRGTSSCEDDTSGRSPRDASCISGLSSSGVHLGLPSPGYANASSHSL